jgi:hypothetical protein
VPQRSLEFGNYVRTDDLEHFAGLVELGFMVDRPRLLTLRALHPLNSFLDPVCHGGILERTGIDAAAMAVHEENRGLNGLGQRIRSATARMPCLGMTALAQVTMSKLIADYSTLVPLLRELGFSAVAFSYPQQARLGSSSLAWSSDSRLVNFDSTELVEAFDAVDDLRELFPVNNPRASIADMKQHLRGQPERFVCYGGYKSFYMDWKFDIWRCDAWNKPMCSVWEFAETPLIRDGCTACIADCYRDSSVMLHFAVSLGDAIDRLGEGRVLAALRTLATGRNVTSLKAVVENASVLAGLAKRG